MRDQALNINAFAHAIVLTALFFVSSAQAQDNSRHPTDAQIKKQMIAESIAAYPGHCPCPYNSASNGSSCGRRSAYSRAGGYSPICYEKDITPQMVEQWRASHGGN
jgi:hypothetical protein